MPGAWRDGVDWAYFAERLFTRLFSLVRQIMGDGTDRVGLSIKAGTLPRPIRRQRCPYARWRGSVIPFCEQPRQNSGAMLLFYLAGEGSGYGIVFSTIAMSMTAAGGTTSSI